MNEQLDLFSFPTYKIKKPVRLIELFAGVGSQAMSLRNIGANFEHYKVVEFDKYAIASYNAIHGTNFPTMDITKVHAEDLAIVNTKDYEYIMTYSFPCTDLSLAGKQAGMKKGSGTRSGLLWEVERILTECKELPQVLLMENVPQVITAEGFEDWLQFLKSKGYVSHYQVLNAKNYGIPQNRERCFMFSFLSNDYIDYTFPQPVKLENRLKDLLEKQVDEKYYLKSEKAFKLIEQIKNKNIISHDTTRHDTTVKLCNFGKNKEPHLENVEIATTLCSRDYKGPNNYGFNGVLEWN